MDLSTFKAAVVVICMLSLGGNDSFVGRIEDYEVGIASDRDRSLAGEKAEQFGRLGAQCLDESVDVEPAGNHPVRVHHVDPLFDAGDTVRDQGERIVPH